MGLAIDFKFDTKQLQNTYQWLGLFDSTARNPEVMDVGVKFLGREIDRNFSRQGYTGMRWAPLSAYTQMIRRERGYGADRPILEQSGTLRDVAAGSLKGWGVGTGRVTSAGPGVKIAAWTGQLAFTAKISGEKVQNQFGGRMSSRGLPAGGSDRNENRGHLPARPFFGLTHAGVLQARDHITKKIMTDWAARSKYAKRK